MKVDMRLSDILSRDMLLRFYLWTQQEHPSLSIMTIRDRSHKEKVQLPWLQMEVEKGIRLKITEETFLSRFLLNLRADSTNSQ